MANPTYQSGFYAPGRGTALHPELWRGCVGAWNPGLGNTGLSLRDWSGNQNNGTLTNGPTWGVSGGQQALSFDGTNDYVDVPHNASLNLVNAIALSVWVRPTGVFNEGILMKGPLTGSQGVFGLSVATAGAGWYFRLNGRVSEGYGQEAGGSPQINQWQHVAGTWDGTIMALYVDNVLIGSSAYSTPIAANSDSLKIGAYYDMSYTFPGLIDDVRIYNRGLSPQEVRTLAQRPGIAYELAPRKFYSLPATASTRQYKLLRPSILRGA